LTQQADDGERTALVPSGDSDNEAAARGVDPSVGLPLGVRELLDADRTAVMVLGLDAHVHAANETALELLGADRVEAVHAGTASHAVLRSILDHAPRHLVDGRASGTWQGDVDHTDPMGDHRVFRATVTTSHDRRLPGGGFIGVMAHDVTLAREQAAELRHRATHDPLTGLANRRQILATLAHAVSRQEGTTGRVAAIFIDVDRLKYVNDALGHQVGDRLLVSVSQRLTETTRPQDHVARIGGDEFLIVCSDITDEAAALELAERARRALTGRLRLRRIDVHFSVSIGVALSDRTHLGLQPHMVASTLISNADTAMYEAKSTGRGRSVLYTPEMHTAARERTELGAELTRAIDDRQLTIEYQPVFSAITREAVGAEALVRWRHPDRGLVDPTEFVSIAEDSGSIGKLGEFVLDHALAEARLWIESGRVGRDFSVHVNVSGMQLASASFVNRVLAMVRSHRLEPHQLVLEARETALLGRNPDIDRTVRSLRRVGIGVAIDNFGTGANALSVLTEVGADILKLDGALGLPIGSSDSDTRLVRAVVLLAHALDMRVVAERVNNGEQLRRLRAAGCDYVQGNLLAPPGPPEQLAVATSH
jgi:diguanylate cyclase (GGDEF)-like protein